MLGSLDRESKVIRPQLTFSETEISRFGGERTFFRVVPFEMAGRSSICQRGDGGAQPVPVVVEFYDGIIIFHRAGWSTSLGKNKR
jgi:hypothetical protein